MKFFTTLLLIISAINFSSGQCVPDSGITHNIPGTYPDSATGIPHAVVGLAYSTVIHANILTDTTVGPFFAVIDSIVVENVTGLPTGFNYTCTPNTCGFPAGTNGCILLEGPAPTLGMVGSYPLVVNTRIYFKISGVPQNQADYIDDYILTIDSTTTGISSPEKIFFTAGQNIPNPARDHTLIPLTLQKSGEIKFTLTNLIGKRIIDRTFNLQKGKTNIPVDLHDLQPGIYIYTFSNGNNTIARRMIISRD